MWLFFLNCSAQAINSQLKNELEQLRETQGKSKYRAQPPDEDQYNGPQKIYTLTDFEIDNFDVFCSNQSTNTSLQKKVNAFAMHLMNKINADWKQVCALSNTTPVAGTRVRAFNDNKLKQVLIDLTTLLHWSQYTDVGLLIYNLSFDDDDYDSNCRTIFTLTHCITDSVNRNIKQTIYQGALPGTDKYKQIQAGLTDLQLLLKEIYDYCLETYCGCYVNSKYNVDNAMQKLHKVKPLFVQYKKRKMAATKIQALYRGHAVRKAQMTQFSGAGMPPPSPGDTPPPSAALSPSLSASLPLASPKTPEIALPVATSLLSSQLLELNSLASKVQMTQPQGAGIPPSSGDTPPPSASPLPSVKSKVQRTVLPTWISSLSGLRSTQATPHCVAIPPILQDRILQPVPAVKEMQSSTPLPMLQGVVVQQQLSVLRPVMAQDDRVKYVSDKQIYTSILPSAINSLFRLVRRIRLTQITQAHSESECINSPCGQWQSKLTESLRSAPAYTVSLLPKSSLRLMRCLISYSQLKLGLLLDQKLKYDIIFYKQRLQILIALDIIVNQLLYLFYQQTTSPTAKSPDIYFPHDLTFLVLYFILRRRRRGKI